MYTERELTGLFEDAEPRLVICQTERIGITRAAMSASGLCAESVLATVPSTYQSRNDRRVLDSAIGEDSLAGALLATDAQQPLLDITLSPDEAGLLLYTSGTTGRPKGTILSHRALAFNAETCKVWFDLGDEPSILALAPLFHITGFVCQFCAALRTHGSMVLAYRFHPEVMLETIREHRPSFAIGAITAYNALMRAPSASPEAFSSFQRLYSGGAPISPALVAEFFTRTGKRLLPAYGMTETCAPTHVALVGIDVPINAQFGALSIGIPTSDVEARIVDDAGKEVAAGEPGELLLRGPQIMSGYWRREAETKEAVVNGWLLTGDVVVMDTEGWFFLVDRKKDVIVVSGFKVWPREVEDVLYMCPLVREAAVIGIPDDYRGETVKAYVSLVSGVQVEPAELVAFCRERLAGYKVPRMIEILPDLPKTTSGKLMRAALRLQDAAG
jgi:long-chain acyl-CoA synthetase